MGAYDNFIAGRNTSDNFWGRNPNGAAATDYIVINGVKARPLITFVGTDVLVAWEFEVNGVWKEQSSRTNP